MTKLPDPVDYLNLRIDALQDELDLARWHLARVMPSNWDECSHTVDAVRFLGGAPAMKRLQRMEKPR